MLSLSPIIARVRALLADDTDPSVTYAALEARLAIEKVCYDRLRQRHDYISQADIRGWTPSYVVNTIMAEVDPDFTQTMTLMIGKNPGAEPDQDDYVEVGTEIGFDAALLSKQWNALAKLALHARLPEDRSADIPDYGDKARIRAKVEEVVQELERLAKGTMTFSGLGEEVSFECACGQKNKRKAALLKSGQSISCFNPKCGRSYAVEIEDDGIGFVLESAQIPCAACGAVTLAPRRELLKMKYEEAKIVECKTCGHANRIMWILARADLPKDQATAVG